MKRVYVAGAYSDDNVIGVLKNIGRGQYWSGRIFQAGMAPFCPWFDKEYVIMNWEDDFDVEKFYAYSLAWLEPSDAVFVIPNYRGLKDWQDSKGTLAEIKQAKELGIPVFYTWDKLIAWKNSQ